MGRKATMPKRNDEAPQVLEDSIFYGLDLDDNQKKFRDAIWDPAKLIIFCNARAGSGKTLLATATANLLVQYGLYQGLVYICSPYGEDRQGFLPGTLGEKSEPYFEPLYQALQKIRIDANIVRCEDIMNLKNGTGYIECMTHTFLRGVNFENKVIIIDEAQNFTFMDLKKTLTRIADSCKVIVIGHDQQCDIKSDDSENAFVKYLNHFQNESYCSVCHLTKNYRGTISQKADEATNFK